MEEVESVIGRTGMPQTVEAAGARTSKVSLFPPKVVEGLADAREALRGRGAST